MFLQRFSQRISTVGVNRLAITAAAQRSYYKDNVLMPRE